MFKINVIKTLLFRAYNISSNYFLMHQEFDFLKQYFQQNGYPEFLFVKNVRRFLHRIFSANDRTESNSNNLIKKYFSLPFFRPQSDKMQKERKLLFLKHFPKIDVNIVLVNNWNIGSFFNYKDSLPLCAQTSVVYEYKYSQCRDAMYIGSTYRTLHARMSEHKGVSPRTGARLTSYHSAVRHHAENKCGAAVSVESFKILDMTRDDKVGLRILESLYIFKRKPNLNDANSSFPLNIVR